MKPLALLALGLSTGTCATKQAPPGDPQPSPPALSPAYTATPPPDKSPAEHCGPECCPAGYPRIDAVSGEAKRKERRSYCVLGLQGADTISAGPLGDVLIASFGDDIVLGGPRRDTVLADDGDDDVRSGQGADHIDGGYGDDRIDGGEDSDLILAGPGNDEVEGGSGADQIYGGLGADIIRSGDGSDTLMGGGGDDELVAGLGDDRVSGGTGRDTIRGGPGNDALHGGPGDDQIEGGPGDDSIYPGKGADRVAGGAGNDRIALDHPCEFEPGEVIDGGEGEDVVVSGFTQQELEEFGIRFVSIEEFFQVKNRPIEAACDVQDETLERLEVSGLVVDSQVFWIDAAGNVSATGAPQGTRALLYTRHTLEIDGFYGNSSGSQSLPAVDVYQLGGSFDTLDGRRIEHEACCLPRLEQGRRYRLELRELRLSEGYAGYELATMASGPFEMGLFLQLPSEGPIPLSAPRPEDEAAGSSCSPPSLFPTPEASVAWSQANGRWDQNQELCPGELDNNECRVAVPGAFRIDPNTLGPMADGEDPLPCDYNSFQEAILSGASVWTNAGGAGTEWGYLSPGAPTSPAISESCEASIMDNMGDGRNCIAMDRPNPDIPGAASQQMKLGPSVRGLEMRELDLDTELAGVFRKVESDVLLNTTATVLDDKTGAFCRVKSRGHAYKKDIAAATA